MGSGSGRIAPSRIVFNKALDRQWEDFSKRAGKPPTVIVVGIDKAAGNVRLWLDSTGRDAHVITDTEMSETALIMCDDADLALLKGDARHSFHGHLLGGGKN